MFEGVPTYPDAGRFWKMIQDHKVTVFYTAPTAIRSLIKAGGDLPKKYDLSSLRILGTVGEPINPEAWMWYHETVGGEPLPDRRHLVADRDRRPHDHAAARRDADQARLGHVPAARHLRRHRRRDRRIGRPRQGRHPRHQAAVARRCCARSGAIRSASRRPTTRQDFQGSYYLAGDGATYDEDGYIRIMGRIDDVLNVAGHRLGTMEIESALVANPQGGRSRGRRPPRRR